MLRFLKSALLSGVPFGLGRGVFFFLRSWNLTESAVLALFCGLLFGVFHRRVRRDRAPERCSPRRESSRAKRHGLNAQNRTLDIGLHQIETARPSLTLALIPNGLQVTCRRGAVESFVVSGRKDWARELSQAVALLGTAGAQSLSSP